jgi:hypothetical protein
LLPKLRLDLMVDITHKTRFSPARDAANSVLPKMAERVGDRSSFFGDWARGRSADSGFQFTFGAPNQWNFDTLNAGIALTKFCLFASGPGFPAQASTEDFGVAAG